MGFGFGIDFFSFMRKKPAAVAINATGLWVGFRTLTCGFGLKRSQNFLLHKEQLNGFSFECSLTCSFRLKSLDNFCHVTNSLMGFLLSVLWRDHSEWKVQTISCCTRCSRMSFQLSLLWRTDSDWKIRRTSCYIAAKWVFFWVYSDVLIQIEKLGKLLVT